MTPYTGPLPDKAICRWRYSGEWEYFIYHAPSAENNQTALITPVASEIDLEQWRDGEPIKGLLKGVFPDDDKFKEENRLLIELQTALRDRTISVFQCVCKKDKVLARGIIGAQPKK